MPHPERFARTARLLRGAEFKRVFQDPLKTADALFTVLARRNEAGGGRLGLAISKKHVRTAVARNRIKRLVRESFRKRRASLSRLDIVVLGRQGLGDQPNPLILQSLRGHWDRLARQCKKS